MYWAVSIQVSSMGMKRKSFTIVRAAARTGNREAQTLEDIRCEYNTVNEFE